MDVRKETLDFSSLNSPNISNIFLSTSRNGPFNTECSIKNSNDEFSSRKKLNILIDGFNETTEQNITINNEILNLFSKMDLKPNKFSSTVKELLQKLKIIEGEDILDLDETTFRLNMINKKIAEKKQEREEKKVNMEYDKCFKYFNKLDEKLQKLFSAVMELEQEIQDESKSIENNVANQILMKNKIEEYEKKIEQMSMDIQDMNVAEINPSNILMKSNIYSEKKAELYQIDKDLNYYADLPPNLLQAKIALEQKNQEYKEILKKLNTKLS